MPVEDENVSGGKVVYFGMVVSGVSCKLAMTVSLLAQSITFFDLTKSV